MSDQTVNADPAELAKFSDLAHRWWDPESEFRPLHQINPLRLEWIQSLFPLAGNQVLDHRLLGGRHLVVGERLEAIATELDAAWIWALGRRLRYHGSHQCERTRARDQ